MRALSLFTFIRNYTHDTAAMLFVEVLMRYREAFIAKDEDEMARLLDHEFHDPCWYSTMLDWVMNCAPFNEMRAYVNPSIDNFAKIDSYIEFDLGDLFRSTHIYPHVGGPLLAEMTARFY